MKQFINKVYKLKAFIGKLLLFFMAVLTILYLFPKGGSFKYEFQKGKPWLYNNLYAPFDFPIYKLDEVLEKERDELLLSNYNYYQYDNSVKQTVKAIYEKEFYEVFSNDADNTLYNIGVEFLDTIYKRGVLFLKAENHRDKIYLVKADKEVELRDVNTFVRINNLDRSLIKELRTRVNEVFVQNFHTVFFKILVPNIIYNETLSKKVNEEMLSSISLLRGNVNRGERIIAKGEIVEGKQYNILVSLKKEYQSQVWNDKNFIWLMLGYFLLIASLFTFMLLYLRKYHYETYRENSKITLILLNILLVILITIWVINYDVSYLYMIPFCILPLTLKPFLDRDIALFIHLLTIFILGFVVPDTFEFIFIQSMAGIIAILAQSELYRRAKLFITVGQITLYYILSYLSFVLIKEGSLSNIDMEMFLIFSISALITLFVQPLVYVYEKTFNLMSDVSLLELSNTNSKLLKHLSINAPGTFNHSLQVANLAEAAANEIGANALLVRAGALYHDIGKLKISMYFSENQVSIKNLHDEIEPLESAEIIINHVINGIELAKKNKLPDRIIDFIRTHHGTTVVRYFYILEKKKNTQIDINKFKYPGPLPYSKETAILMMADAVEASSKSLKYPTQKIIHDFVEKIVISQINQKQFENTNITFKEIEVIKKVFKRKLINIYNLRVEYPD